MLKPETLKAVAGVLKTDISYLLTEETPKAVGAAMVALIGLPGKYAPEEINAGRILLRHSDTTVLALMNFPRESFPKENMSDNDVNELKGYIRSYVSIYLDDPNKPFSEIEAKANNAFNSRQADLGRIESQAKDNIHSGRPYPK